MVKDEDLCVALRPVRGALPDRGLGHAEVGTALPLAVDEARMLAGANPGFA